MIALVNPGQFFLGLVNISIGNMETGWKILFKKITIFTDLFSCLPYLFIIFLNQYNGSSIQQVITAIQE